MPMCKILLADDDPEDRSIIKDAMQVIEAGDIICFAENGEQALQWLTDECATGDCPQLIVLDLNMPRLNGTETLRVLKTDDRLKHIPVIIFSTSINVIEKEKCMGLGAHSYITKPVTYQECLATARAFYKFCESEPVA